MLLKNVFLVWIKQKNVFGMCVLNDKKSWLKYKMNIF